MSCMKGTVKFGRGNIMFWGSIAWKGVGKLAFVDSKMDATLYREILKSNLKPSAQKLRLRIFQQDNDPKHTAKETTKCFSDNVEWPAENPDLNLIEYLWAILDRKIGDQSLRMKEEQNTKM